MKVKQKRRWVLVDHYPLAAEKTQKENQVTVMRLRTGHSGSRHRMYPAFPTLEAYGAPELHSPWYIFCRIVEYE